MANAPRGPGWYLSRSLCQGPTCGRGRYGHRKPSHYRQGLGIQRGLVHPLHSMGPHSPSQSKSANTTSHTWSDSSTFATVLATCCMVTEGRKCWVSAVPTPLFSSLRMGAEPLKTAAVERARPAVGRHTGWGRRAAGAPQ